MVLALTLDSGRGGVFDSPRATDELVREFGFLFGGGRSGVKGLEAFQVSQNQKFKLFGIILV